MLAILFAGCQPEEFTPDENLLYGKWVINNTEFWRYNSDHTGSTWDERDSVYEWEAQLFTWELEGAQLTQYHKMENSSAVVPKTYTVVSLTKEELQYEDYYGNIKTFSRR